MSTPNIVTNPVHYTQRELDELQKLIDEGELPPDAIAQHYTAEALNVFGHDAKKGPDGKYIEQGIGAKGRESKNHFDALLKAEREGYEKEGSYDNAVREIWRRDPDRAKLLGLPQPGRTAA